MKKYTSAFAVVLFAVVGALWVNQSVLAAAGSIYLTPSTQSISKDSTFTVNLRVNPGMDIDTITATINYDAAKVGLVSVDCGGSPFSPFPSCPTPGGSPVSVTGAKLGGSVNTDSFVAKFTFQAKVGSGSTTFALSGNDATAGAANNPGATSATVSFTTPACPAGQVGTYPSCTTPPSTGTSGGVTTPRTTSPTTTPTITAPKQSTTPTKSSAPTTTTTPTTSEAPVTPISPTSTVAPVVTVVSKQVDYSQALLNVTSDQPTQISIRYSTDQQKYNDTPYGELATNHDVALDPSMLQPGQTYYYVVLVKDQQGNATQTDVKTFKTKGLSIKVGVFDKNHHPLRNKTVTLHSKAYTVKTDKGGFASFSDITAGTHHVTYTSGKKDYVQEIKVENSVKTIGDTQTATLQNMAVVIPINQTNSVFTTTSSALLIVLLAVAGYVVYRQRRLLKPLLIPNAAESDDSTALITALTRPMPVTPRSENTPEAEMKIKSEIIEAKLAALPKHDTPLPGTTIAPSNTDEDNK